MGISEAEEWLRTGVEPSPPAFVSMPPFSPPPGFQRAVSSAPLSIQLSMQSISVFSIKEGDKPEEETDASLLYGQSEGAGASGSSAFDTAREPPAGRRITKIDRRTKNKMRIAKAKRKSLSKRRDVKKKWRSSIPLAIDNVQGVDDKAERIQLISEILVLLYGDDAEGVAEELKYESDNERSNNKESISAALAAGSPPKIQKRYGKQPGPGWKQQGMSRLGTPIWIWSPNTGRSTPKTTTPRSPTTPPPAPKPRSAPSTPPTTPTPSPTAQPVPPVAPTTQPSQPTAQPPKPQSPWMARVAKAQTVHADIMAKLSAGQLLTDTDKSNLARNLNPMNVAMLRQLHTSLGGTGSLVGTRTDKVNAVKAILSGTSQPQTQQPTPTTSSTALPKEKADSIRLRGGQAARDTGPGGQNPYEKNSNEAAAWEEGKAEELRTGDIQRSREDQQRKLDKETSPELAATALTKLQSVLGDKLDVSGQDSQFARAHIIALAKVPDNIHKKLIDAGLNKIRVGNGAVTSFSGYEYLSNESPRGWGGTLTWDDVAGMYDPAHKQVICGTGVQGARALSLHEYGHAIGDLLEYDNDPTLINFHKKLHPQLSPYEQQGGPGGFAGRQELLANAFMRVVEDPIGAAVRYGPDLVQWIESVVMSGESYKDEIRL